MTFLDQKLTYTVNKLFNFVLGSLFKQDHINIETAVAQNLIDGSSNHQLGRGMGGGGGGGGGWVRV